MIKVIHGRGGGGPTRFYPNRDYWSQRGLGNQNEELMGKMCLEIFHPVSRRVTANFKHLSVTLPSHPLHPEYLP